MLCDVARIELPHCSIRENFESLEYARFVSQIGSDNQINIHGPGKQPAARRAKPPTTTYSA